VKVLVTGSAGFIGYHLAKALADEGHTVYCVDNGIRGEYDHLYRELIARSSVTDFRWDLTDTSSVAQLPLDVESIFHLAAFNGTQNFYDRPLEVVRCCTLPTLNLLQHYGGGAGHVQQFIYASSSEVYASTVTRFNWPVPTAEDVPLSIDNIFNPRWSYAASKIHGEVTTVAACRQYKISHVIIRYHNVYGPRMGEKHVIPDFYLRAIRGVFELYGYEDTRAFMYIDDAIRATLALVKCKEADAQIINVGGTREISIYDLAKLMMNAMGLDHDITLYPSPNGSVRRRCPDVRKLRQIIGFAESWSLEEGLKATARFYTGRRYGAAGVRSVRG
jgi:nucleoside-diphosphate-sugar epimerase